MTAITGYKCDICGSFGLERKGWMKLEIHETRPNDPGFQDICSNRCLANLAVARLRDIDGEEFIEGERKERRRRVYSDETKQLVVLRACRTARPTGWRRSSGLQVAG